MKTKKEGRRKEEGRKKEKGSWIEKSAMMVQEKKKRERQETEKFRKLEEENIKNRTSKGDMRKGENRIEKQKYIINVKKKNEK